MWNEFRTFLIPHFTFHIPQAERPAEGAAGSPAAA
jgi:hypothetical protein